MTYIPSLSCMMVQSSIYLLGWTSWAGYIRRRGPIPVFRRITIWNSWFYSLCSVAQLLLIISPYLPPALSSLACDSPDGLRAREVYHWSKTYEYVDVFNVVASGGAVDLHFGFHHLTTPWLTWARVLGGSGRSGEEGWRLFAALNAAHHVLMYAFFGGFRRIRDVLVITGAVQLVAGISGEMWMLGTGAGEEVVERWRCWVSLSLLTCYFLLFLRDLWTKGLLPFQWLWRDVEVDGKME